MINQPFKGFIIVKRDIQETGLWQKPFYLGMFIKLVMLANYKDKEWFCRKLNHSFLIKRGQLATTQEGLGQELGGLTRQATRTFLKFLETNKKMTQDTTRGFTLITILDYEDYHLPITRGLTEGQPELNQSLTTTKRKKKKKRKKVNNTAKAVEDKNSSKGFSTGTESLGEILGRLEVLPQTKPPSYKKWQDHALRLAERAGVKPTASWFKVFKNAHLKSKARLLEAATSYVADAENVESKEKLFYWKFWQLLKGENP